MPASTFQAITPPRLVLLFTALSLAAWLLPLWVAGAILAVALAAGLRLGLLQRAQRGKLKAYGFFLLFWGLSTLLLQWAAADLPLSRAAANAADLILRLAALAGLTLDLSLLLTPFALAKTLAAMLAPALGQTRAHNAALALAVMLRLIPQAGHCLHALQHTRQMRCRHLPLSRQLSLMTGAALRHLSFLAWRQSLALAARNIHLTPQKARGAWKTEG